MKDEEDSVTSPEAIDQSKLFLFFLNFQGDLNRTALAADLPIEEVTAIAEREAWRSKIESFSALMEKDENAQVDLNRALNYVQARQLSTLVDKLIVHLSELPKEELFKKLVVENKDSFKFETKPILDLAKAAEAVQRMSRVALGDLGEPAGKRDKGKGGSKVGLSVANTLNAIAANNGLDAVQIVQNSLSKSNVDERLPSGANG